MDPRAAEYDSAEFSSNGSAICGYCSAKKMQINGPARRGDTILPDGTVIFPNNAGYDSAEFSSNGSAIMRDIVLLKNAEQYPALLRKPSRD